MPCVRVCACARECRRACVCDRAYECERASRDRDREKQGETGRRQADAVRVCVCVCVDRVRLMPCVRVCVCVRDRVSTNPDCAGDGYGAAATAPGPDALQRGGGARQRDEGGSSGTGRRLADAVCRRIQISATAFCCTRLGSRFVFWSRQKCPACCTEHCRCVQRCVQYNPS